MRHSADSARLFARLPLRGGCAILLVAGSLAVPVSARGQGGLVDRVKQKVQDRANTATDSLTDAALDKATGAVQCAATNTACIKKVLGAGKTVKVVDAKGNPVSPTDSAKAVAAAGEPASTTAASSASTTTPAGASVPAVGDGVFVNYDFVPGDRVIFAEDFARDNVGDFPKRLELKSGNYEVAQWQGQRFLRSTSGGTVIVPLPELLPSRFTFEADYNGGRGWSMDARFGDPDADLALARFSPTDGGLEGAGVASTSSIPDGADRPVTHIAVRVDGKYAKTYVNGVRVSNVPNANLGRAKAIELSFTASQDEPSYITNLRVAAGGKPLYDAIMGDGRVATHGILFDTGSDRIRGESKPTLDLIGQMLKDHADLKLTIEGHTDNVSPAAANQTLSDKRAAAVRQFLVANYHVDAARLASKGLGATKPAASNDTPEGRQQNRRVELVKN